MGLIIRELIMHVLVLEDAGVDEEVGGGNDAGHLLPGLALAEFLLEPEHGVHHLDAVGVGFEGFDVGDEFEVGEGDFGGHALGFA